MLNEQGKCKQQVMLAIFDHFSIEPEVFEKTGAEVRQVPASLELMKKCASKNELESRLAIKGEGYEPLAKEVALKHIKEVEERKVKLIAGAAIAVKLGRIPQGQMGMI